MAAADAEEQQVRPHSERIAGEWPPSGYRRVSAQLRRAGAGAVNGQRVRRRMGERGLVGPTPVRRCRTTNHDHASPRSPHLVVDLTVRQPDAVWVADSTSRSAASTTSSTWRCSWTCIRGRSAAGNSADLSIRRSHGQQWSGRWRPGRCPAVPSIHHCDQGVQYAATAYVAQVEQRGVPISMAEQGEPRQNGYAERLMRTIKEEAVARTEYRDCADAYAPIGRFLDAVYQHKRIHSALGYLTPLEFAAAYHARLLSPTVIPSHGALKCPTLGAQFTPLAQRLC